MRRSDYVQEEYQDSDGYWIVLRPGFQNGSDPGTHAIVEDTKTQANRTLKSVTRCDCRECQDLKRKP